MCSLDLSLGGGGWSYGTYCGDEGFETEKEAKYSLLSSAETAIIRKIKSIQDAEEYEENYEFDYGEQRLQENRVKIYNNLLKKVRYYQDVYSNQTLF